MSIVFLSDGTTYELPLNASEPNNSPRLERGGGGGGQRKMGADGSPETCGKYFATIATVL